MSPDGSPTRAIHRTLGRRRGTHLDAAISRQTMALHTSPCKTRRSWTLHAFDGGDKERESPALPLRQEQTRASRAGRGNIRFCPSRSMDAEACMHDHVRAFALAPRVLPSMLFARHCLFGRESNRRSSPSFPRARYPARACQQGRDRGVSIPLTCARLRTFRDRDIGRDAYVHTPPSIPLTCSSRN